MPADRSEFQIKIKSSADLAGLDATIAKLKGQIEATEKLGKSTAHLEAQLHKAQQTKIEAALAGMTGKMKEVGEGGKKASEGIEEMIGGHHGIHAIGHALNQAMPGMMQFTRFLTSGFTAAIGAVLLAFEYLKDKIEEFSKMLDELDSGPGARGEWAEKMADNVREAAVEEAVFNERLKETLDAQETLAASTDRLIAAQKQHAADEKTIGDAQKSLDEARLALMEKLGQLTPDQVLKIKLQIDDEAFKRQLAAEIAGIQAELNTRMAEGATNNAGMRDLEWNKNNKAADALDAKNAADKNAAKLAQDKANNDKDKETLEKADAQVKELKATETFGMTVNPVEYAQRKSAESTVASLQKIIENREASMRTEKGRQTPLESDAGVAKKQAEEASQKLDEAVAETKKNEAEVKKLKADLAATVAKNAVLQSIHDKTSATTSAANTADMVNRVHEGRGSPRENAQVQDLDSQAQWSKTPASDIFSSVSEAKSAVFAAHGAVKSREGNPQELHALLNEVVGLANDIHASAAQKHDMDSLAAELRRDIANIQSRLQHTTGGAGY